MNIDRKLLWQAWPDGFLAMRGVQTVGGYDCVTTRDGSLRWLQAYSMNHTPEGFWLDGVRLDREACQQGDLLPNVDPSDTATWACLLRDLAEAFPVDSWCLFSGPEEPTWLGPGQMHRFDISWMQKSRDGEPAYRLRVVSRKINNATDDYAESTIYYCGFVFDRELDPTTALVLARIQLREKAQ